MTIRASSLFPQEHFQEQPTKQRHVFEPEERARVPALREKIKVIGVGGGGTNALNHIIKCGISGVDFLAVNTDSRNFETSLCPQKLILGRRLTQGRGAGSRPDIGAQAAQESREEIRAALKGYDMIYLAAGMGGGTGTGALPIIAEQAKDLGILTVAVVTKPFVFEGKKRQQNADTGIERLEEVVDALIVVPNERLLAVSSSDMSLVDAFALADDVLRQAVQGVTDLVMRPGLVNVDFADLRSVMTQAGSAVMGIGVARGENRAQEALLKALESPLMEYSMQGAKGVLFNITGGSDIGMLEISEAAEILQNYCDPDAKFVWGCVQDSRTDDSIQMVVVATGLDREPRGTMAAVVPQQTRPTSTPHAQSLAQPAPTPQAAQVKSQQEETQPETYFAHTPTDEYDTPTVFRRDRRR